MKKGFTLIELMVVMAIIAILSSIALVGIGKMQAMARDTKRASIMNGVRTALERYYADNQTYPDAPSPNWSSLTNALINYITIPNDPCVGGTPIGADGTVANCTGVLYEYIKGNSGSCTNTNGYALILHRESGGTNQYFCSPL